jgi:cytochrome d ubiquinol oxidase subunit I
MDYKKAKENKNTKEITQLKERFEDNNFRKYYFRYFGYAFLQNPSDIIPDVSVTFYAFHLMVILGFFFILVFAFALYYILRDKILKHRWFLWIALFAIPLPYLAGELGWILTETGRQPWIIQDLMPVSIAVSQISAGSVQTTFWLFALLFTALLIAEISIMLKQIKIGPKHQE